MAVEAVFVHNVGDKSIKKLDKKIEEKIINKSFEEKNDIIINDRNLNKNIDNIEAENSCNSIVKTQFKNSNLSTTRSSTWIATRKNVRTMVLTFLFLCLSFTIKSTIQTSASIPSVNNHLSKNIMTFQKNMFTTLISSFQVNLAIINGRIKEKYHIIKEWLFEDVKDENHFLITTSHSWHEDEGTIMR